MKTEELPTVEAIEAERDALQRALDRTSDMLEHERSVYQENIDRLEDEVRLLRAGIKSIRLNAIRIRDAYMNGERVMYLDGADDPIHASRVLQGPIAALLLVVGNCNSVEAISKSPAPHEGEEKS